MTDSVNFNFCFIINITINCNENTFAYVILLKLHPIVKVFKQQHFLVDLKSETDF